MNIIESIILGFVQGITEFLPISSTGHLWILEQHIFRLESSTALEIFFHAATLMAVILFFWKRIWSLSKNLVLPSGKYSEKIFAGKLIIATAITGVLGILMKDHIEENINTTLVATTLFITGGFILISEYFSPKNKKKFSWSMAVFLGAIQAIALLPGISRSGITIVFLLLSGIGKKQALEISFLLSVPTILGAFIFLLPEISDYPAEIGILAIGGLVAFITAFCTIWLMMNHIARVWKWFALWCFGVGSFLLIYF